MQHLQCSKPPLKFSPQTVFGRRISRFEKVEGFPQVKSQVNLALWHINVAQLILDAIKCVPNAETVFCFQKCSDLLLKNCSSDLEKLLNTGIIHLKFDETFGSQIKVDTEITKYSRTYSRQQRKYICSKCGKSVSRSTLDSGICLTILLQSIKVE